MMKAAPILLVIFSIFEVDGLTSNFKLLHSGVNNRVHTHLHLKKDINNSISYAVERRTAITSIVTAALLLGSEGFINIKNNEAMALDMDAFIKSELDADIKNCDPKKGDPKCIPKLSSDEALCKYGQSGNARGEACERVKSGGGKLPEAKKEKSPGGAYAM